MSLDVYSLPSCLPVPQDDGGAGHLTGLELPGLVFPSGANAGEVLAWLRSR